MNLDWVILKIEDADAILEFESQQLAKSIEDPMERELKSWHAPWRREALEFYLPLGWSFGAWRDGQLQGYFLAQPMLFFEGMTQNLWLEHISSPDPSLFDSLMEVAVKLSREKHFQRVLMSQATPENVLNSYRARPCGGNLIEILTAKVR